LDKTIAVEEGFYNHNYLSKNHQDTKLVLRKDTLGALQAVSYGEADLTIGILPIEAHTIRVNGLNNLKIVGVSSDKLFAPKELRMAVALGNDTLKGILQKGLDDITETEKSEIVKKWVTVDLKAQTDWILIGKIFGGFFLIISAIGFYTWRVKKIQKKHAWGNYRCQFFAKRH
jgi:ABC-type amino acid transport substrate-binding protein